MPQILKRNRKLAGAANVSVHGTIKAELMTAFNRYMNTEMPLNDGTSIPFAYALK
jgi:hypothetical protein